MPRVDWPAWEALGASLPPLDDAARALLWTVLSTWLPPAGLELRRYRASLPQLWAFQL